MILLARGVMLGLICITLILGQSRQADAHQPSFSQLEVWIGLDATLITVQIPITALFHATPNVLPPQTTTQTFATTPLSDTLQIALSALIRARLHIADGRAVLPFVITAIRVSGDNLELNIVAPQLRGALAMDASLFPNDTLHKVFVTVYRDQALAGQYVLDLQTPGFVLAAIERPVWQVIISFIREGILHVFIGPDHILFVVALVLLGGPMWSQVRIITAFTAAHSITLTLATLGIVLLPARLVESVIAFSIVVVGLHDLRQLRRGDAQPRLITDAAIDLRVAFAFVFGLVHGFGFASVLVELDLPRFALGWSLAGFNIGVEIAQVMIVLMAATLLIVLRHKASPEKVRAFLIAAAFGVVAMGSYWLWQRAFGASLS